MKEITRKLTSKAKKLQKEVRARTGLAIAAAFALVIGLSWNEFMKEAVMRLVLYFGLDGHTLWLKLTAAILTTIICVIGISYFSRWGK
jgi:hypothetical protein